MRLVLSLDPPEQRINECVFDEHGGYIGHDHDCAWVLDAVGVRYTRRCALVSFDEGNFWLNDTSHDGIFHNNSPSFIGKGKRVPIADGDVFRIAGLTVKAAIVAERPGGESPTGHDPGAVQSAQTRFMGKSGASEAVRSERGSKGAAPIPADWDSAEAPPSGNRHVVPALSLSRRLAALEHTAAEKLLRQLCPESDGAHGEICPQAAGNLGAVLRVSIDALLALQAEVSEIEQRLAGVPPTDASVETSDVADTARRFRQRLLDAEDGAVAVAELASVATGLAGRHRALHDATADAAKALIEELAPARMEQRWRAACTDGRGGSIRITMIDRLFAIRGRWRFYRRWFESGRKGGYRVLSQFFTGCLLTSYRERKHGSAEGVLRPDPIDTPLFSDRGATV